MEDSIDLQVHKLLEWLVDRGHVAGGWAEQLRELQARIKAAVEALPSDGQATALLQGHGLDYEACSVVLKGLMVEDRDTRGIFGTYSSVRVQEWQGICSTYQQANLHVAHGAAMLVHTATHLLPALRKDMARTQRAAQDCRQGEAAARAALQQHRAAYRDRCSALGIQGQDVEGELQQGTALLPGLYVGLAQVLQGADVQAARAHYDHVVASTCTGPRPPTELPLLAHVGLHGNAPMAQWLACSSAHEPAAAGRGQVQGPGDEGLASAVDAPAWVLEDEGTDMDWGIEECAPDTQQPTAELGVLEDAGWRQQLATELLELQAFLQSGLAEANHTDVLAMQLKMEAGGGMGRDAGRLQVLAGAVQAALNRLTDPALRQWEDVARRTRAAERTVSGLLQMQANMARAEERALALAARGQEVAEEAAGQQRRLQQLTATAKSLQEQVERAISQLYGGRTVHIVGQINA